MDRDKEKQTRPEVPWVLATSPCVEHFVKAVVPNIARCLLSTRLLLLECIHSYLASPVWWLVEGAIRALLHCQDRLVILLQCQEVNPEAVRHRLLLRVVLELSSSMKEHLTQRLNLRFAFFNFEDSVETLLKVKRTQSIVSLKTEREDWLSVPKQESIVVKERYKIC